MRGTAHQSNYPRKNPSDKLLFGYEYDKILQFTRYSKKETEKEETRRDH